MSVDLTPLAGRPDLVKEDVSNLRIDATQLGELQQDLKRLRIEGSGRAIEGLQQRINEAAAAVNKVLGHYVGAYRALDEYAPELEAAQKSFDGALEGRSKAIEDYERHEHRRSSLSRAAQELYYSGAPAAAGSQVENEAYNARRLRDLASDRIEQAEADLKAARERYDTAAFDALDALRSSDNEPVDVRSFLEGVNDEFADGGFIPSPLSPTGTFPDREEDGGLSFGQNLAWYASTGAAGSYVAGSSWVHNHTIFKSNGIVQWQPYNTLGRDSTGLMTQAQARSFRSVYGRTGGRARSNFVIGPRPAVAITHGLSVAGAAWTFYDVHRGGDTKYWYLAPEDAKAWATLEASAVTAASVTGSVSLAALGVNCGPAVVACAPILGIAGGIGSGVLANSAFDATTYQDRYALAVHHFTTEHPGTEVRNGKLYFEEKPVGYFSIG